MLFHDYTIAGDRVRSHRQHESSTLERRAVDAFAGMLVRHGHDFREPIPEPGFEAYHLQWTSVAEGCAVATFWHGDVPITTSALVSRRDPHADELALTSAYTLAFEMVQVSQGPRPTRELFAGTERPAIFSVILPSAILAGPDAIAMIADMETCLAAAFFERL